MIDWNINGRIPGSVEYFKMWERNLSKIKKYDNAVYLVIITLEEMVPMEDKSEIAILKHLATLKQPLEFIMNQLRQDAIEMGLGAYIPPTGDVYNFDGWRTTLIYISDRWLDEARIQWMLNLIINLEEKNIIADRSQVLLGINDIKEMEGLI